MPFLRRALKLEIMYEGTTLTLLETTVVASMNPVQHPWASESQKQISDSTSF